MRELNRGARLADRYTLVRKLGGGRRAETWLAEDRLTRASVAVKIWTGPDAGSELLRREWQLSIRLVHPHIVRVFEFHGEPEGAFYSLQYVDGPDIGALTGAPVEDILPPVAAVADALSYAHGKRIVHRDVKASNVLLDAGGAPYLIDFGVAAAAVDAVGGGALIAASPQQLDGAEPAPADDVFALGGLIYELVSGRSPYSSADTAGDIRSVVPPPLAAPDGGAVPATIRELVARMLDKDAGARPQAAEVVTTLVNAGFRPGRAPSRLTGGARALGDERIESERATPATKSPVVTKRDAAVAAGTRGINARIVGISLSLLLLLLAGVVFLLPKTVVRNTSDTVPAVTGERIDEETAGSAGGDEAPRRDERVLAREKAEQVLGRLLAKMRTLEARAIERWGGLPWRRAGEAYQSGDAAYLARDYEQAADHYARAITFIDPLLEQVDIVFRETLSSAEEAFGNADTAEALRLYELAVAISPSHGPALAGLARARNLDTVLALTEQGLALERELELDAARRSFARAREIDPEWGPAADGLERVLAAINQMQFDARMTEGLAALESGDYPAARAAFRVAQQLKPGSPEPADGLLQVDQGLRLDNIATLERRAQSLESGERWQAAVEAYESILELDANLTFANEGLARSKRMSALHEQIEGYIENPDVLSAPRNMQIATQLVVDITRMPDPGPRLVSQRDELSRLLKRAATPLTVEIVSDNLTEVSIYRVGKLGTFARTELSLRPGTYVAVGSRPGYRDVRLEFRVAPEIDMRPVVVRCEERI